MLNIVLFQPEIPPNTGNIARLCVCNGFKLHLIHPLGFSLKKKDLLRAGMDYWDKVDLVEHPSWESFRAGAGKGSHSHLFFFSSKAEKSFWEADYPENVFLVFGSESRGLPQDLHRDFRPQFVKIPMAASDARCLNLSTSVGIAAYEVMRRQGTRL